MHLADLDREPPARRGRDTAPGGRRGRDQRHGRRRRRSPRGGRFRRGRRRRRAPQQRRHSRRRRDRRRRRSRTGNGSSTSTSWASSTGSTPSSRACWRRAALRTSSTPPRPRASSRRPTCSSPYTTSKFAVVGLSESLHAELAPKGIKVSALCPGIIHTPITDRATLRGTMTGENSKITDLPPPRLVARRRRRGRHAAHRRHRIIIPVPRAEVGIPWAVKRLSVRLVMPLMRLTTRIIQR